jgi:hypothetical protein
MRAPFWKKWIPEVLGDAALQSSAVIERAHRIGPARDAKMPPRTLIVKFLIYKGKQQTAVVAAARPKKDIRYKDQQIRFYLDLATGMHQLRKKKDLRNLGIRHGVIHPAKMLVTHKERTYTFNTPAEVQEFIKKIQMDNGGG